MPYAGFRGYSYRAYAASSVDIALPWEAWFEIFTADRNQDLVAPTKLDGNFRKGQQAQSAAVYAAEFAILALIDKQTKSSG